MRIIAGQFRGRLLGCPPTLETRPTTDRVREAIFSALTSRIGEWKNLRILDGFAGSGALGLEALSRGAEWVQFVENSLQPFKTLLHNILALGVKQRCIAYKGDFFTINLQGPFNVVFLDPPYYKGLIDKSLVLLETPGLLFRDALVVSEVSIKDTPLFPASYIPVFERTYGTIKVMVHQFHSTVPCHFGLSA